MSITGLKVLITGCSLSADTVQSGWNHSNLDKTYSKILESSTDWHVDNRAIGGCSNREIFQRTIENCLKTHYDLCIVQWSSLHRLWLYESNNNVEDWTQILPRVTGKVTVDAPHKIQKLVVSHYLNHYVALKHWLHDQVVLQHFFEKNRTPFLFLRGFQNYIPDLEFLIEQWPKNNIVDLNIPDEIKDILMFDSNPDDYLYQSLTKLMLAYQTIRKSSCIGYNRSQLIYGLPTDFKIDYADDGVHPGYSVNLAISKTIIDYVKSF